MVAGTGRISKIWIRGTWPLGAYLVRARAVVKPAIPPPRMITFKPSGEAGAMAVCSLVGFEEGSCGVVGGQ